MFNFRNMPAVPIGIAGTLRIERFTFETGMRMAEAARANGLRVAQPGR
jgi:hypothetical protein